MSKTKKPLVSIIIVNWNGNNVFKECLKSLAKINYPNWELIVVDNGSTDGSEKFPQNFELEIKNYVLIKNNKNVGFAPANNQGYKKAKGKYILFLNYDTKVSTGFLTKMVIRMEKDTLIGALQPKILLIDKNGYLDNCGSFLTKTGFLEHWGFMKKDGKKYNEEREIFSAKGACLLTRRDVVEKVGLFDNTFMSYFEESDFCWRVWLAGYKVLYYPGARIYHKVGMTSKRMSQIVINYHSIKNRILSLFKNLQIGNLITILIPHLLILFALSIYYLLKFQLKKAGMIHRAFYWNVVNFPRAFCERRKVQRLRTKSDNEIFEKILHKISLKDMFIHFRKVEENY